ncbi:MAG TPA: trypsin-like peptidase domain-containing protein [Streptosporangiaceae bacterium]|nr:trypsin-like peptidase domain-containing protein [Streptosporangiaceae bacterium]
MTISQTRNVREEDEKEVFTSDVGQAVPEAWRSKRFRISVIAVAVILAAGLGFGVGRAIGLGNTVILSAIPMPATCQAWVPTSCAFIEDDDLTAQDNQENILESTAPGMVHVLSGGTSVGIGLVLTESGKVLTTYQPSAGAANLAAEYVLARQTFKAKVIGTDPAAGLALLQLEGGNGRPFSTVTVGNSATIVNSAEASRESSYHVPGQVYDTAIGTTGRENTLTIDVGTLATLNTTVTVGSTDRSGLMASVLQSAQTSAIGGPLVNLNGQVIGITVGGWGSGLHIIAYAIPINTALAVATQIDSG